MLSRAMSRTTNLKTGSPVPCCFASAILALAVSQPFFVSQAFCVESFYSLPPFVHHRLSSQRCFHSLRGGDSTSTSCTKSSEDFIIAQNKIYHPRRGIAAARMTSSSTMEAKATTSSTAGSKLSALRSRMKELDLDVYLVPTDDPHLSEYVPAAYMRRKFLTGFCGSAGTALVTHNEARLWTDSRYWNAANLQLDADHWTLVKSGQPDVPTIPKFLGELAVSHYQEHRKPLRVGIDPFVHPASFAKELEDSFQNASNDVDIDDEEDVNGDENPLVIGVIDTSNENLIDPIWGDDRPPIPTSAFRVHPLKYSGMSIDEKVAKIREEMVSKKATLAVFCTLDDVAYLLNVRAMGDIDTCPVGIAYATVSHDEITLYCDGKKVQSSEVQEHLKDVTIKPYDDIVVNIEQHLKDNSMKGKIWMDKSRANYKLSSIIPQNKLVDKQNAITPMKACKNEAELEGMRQAHIVDGAAMAKFMAWLEQTVVVEGKSVSEVEIDLKLTGYRAEQPGFVEVSFPTIAGVGPNGAIIHYQAAEDSELLKYFDTSNPILIDSGGQYEYGTTDVTRTWHFGPEPAQEFVESYTRVLQGNIGLDTMIFPENTPGFVLDVFARKSLWDSGRDYGHGTGHGVGAALNVHEGPMSISPRWNNKETLKKGMVMSNEPGYYEDGNFGVRIENLVEIRYVKDEHNNPYEGKEVEEKPNQKKFLKFEKLTMIPIQKSLINTSLLTEKEMDWLDAYHAEVFERVSPLLEPDSPAMRWLEKSCSKIDRK